MAAPVEVPIVEQSDDYEGAIVLVGIAGAVPKLIAQADPENEILVFGRHNPMACAMWKRFEEIAYLVPYVS